MRDVHPLGWSSILRSPQRWLWSVLVALLLVGGVARAEEAPARDEAEVLRELQNVETDVHALKERVFRTKATLQLLRELLLERAYTGSLLRVIHANDLPKAYTLVGARYALDGKSLYVWDGTGEAPGAQVDIREVALPAGPHTVQVKLQLRGNGSGGFNYIETYTFDVDSSFSFEVEEGQRKYLTVRVYAKGLKKAFQDRPTVVYEERVEQLQGD